MIQKSFIHVINLKIPSHGTEQVEWFYRRVQVLLFVVPLTIDSKENTLRIHVYNAVL